MKTTEAYNQAGDFVSITRNSYGHTITYPFNTSKPHGATTSTTVTSRYRANELARSCRIDIAASMLGIDSGIVGMYDMESDQTQNRFEALEILKKMRSFN